MSKRSAFGGGLGGCLLLLMGGRVATFSAKHTAHSQLFPLLFLCRLCNCDLWKRIGWRSHSGCIDSCIDQYGSINEHVPELRVTSSKRFVDGMGMDEHLNANLVLYSH